MGLKDFIRGELIEIIEFSDDSRGTLAYRFPDDDREIKRGAQLIVRESQAAQFVYLGQFGDLFLPGKHTLTTDNLPVLATLKGWKYGFASPFKADVYFVTTRLFTGNKWGTSNPVMMRDEDFGVVRLRAFGTYDFRVADVPRFLSNVAGTDGHFLLDEFADAMRSRLVSVFSDALAASRIPALDVAGRYRELGDALLPLINPVLQAKYGVELATFVVENISVPAEVEQAIDRRTGMAAVGNLNDFVKYQMAQGLATPGSGTAALGAEMAVGLSMAQQLLQQLPVTAGGLQASGSESVLTPAEAAGLLNVTEADVVASLEAGDLKGRKIGSQWRLTRAQLAQFLR
jgi:excisionase family DNA binding protein